MATVTVSGPAYGQIEPRKPRERHVELWEDAPMGWEALRQWGDDVTRVQPLTGGVANQVWSVRVDGRLVVGRLGARSDADLAWETDLLRHLHGEGLTVPVPVPIATTDGRLFADGLVVMTHVEGRPPETKTDWRRVAEMLRQLHRLTRGWPQRPGWRSSTDYSRPRPGPRSTSVPCRLKALPDAALRGRGLLGVSRALFTVIPIRAISA
jgi:Ser/Thr protein kinase RdoA (MazF antagonist)